MKNIPYSVIAINIFIIINIIIWFAFGGIIALNIHPALHVNEYIKASMAVVSFALFLMLIILYIYLNKRKIIAYYLAIIFFSFESIVLFLDDVGWMDIIALLFSLIPFILLINNRAWYLKENKLFNIK